MLGSKIRTLGPKSGCAAEVAAPAAAPAGLAKISSPRRPTRTDANLNADIRAPSLTLALRSQARSCPAPSGCKPRRTFDRARDAVEFVEQHNGDFRVEGFVHRAGTQLA